MNLTETKMFVIGLLLSTALTIFFFFMLVSERFAFRNNPEKNEGFVVHCKTCDATGETEQDINLLMSEASYAIWLNSHSRNCDACKSGDCEAAANKYKEIMDKYKELGPKIEKAACPDCMGSGSYIQYKGYRVGREK